jgi:hypothetical protein
MKRACLVFIALAVLLPLQLDPSLMFAESSITSDSLPEVTLVEFQASDGRTGTPPRRATEDYGATAGSGALRYPLGYVASFGAFSLPQQAAPPPPPTPEPPGNPGHAMFQARSWNAPYHYCFYDGEMKYDYYAYDPWVCVTGWLYTVDAANGPVRHFLFGSHTKISPYGIRQRTVVVYDEWWNVVNCVCATFGEACQ